MPIGIFGGLGVVIGMCILFISPAALLAAGLGVITAKAFGVLSIACGAGLIAAAVKFST